MLSPVHRPKDLSALRGNMQVARAKVKQARSASAEAGAARAAQRTLVVSIGAFTDELTARGLPIPHALHVEARLYHDVLAVNSR
jgi:hypothetical protein